ncbi:MAG: hypothetical protein ACUVRY_02180 [Thermoanaerobaculaceae bacterium]
MSLVSEALRKARAEQRRREIAAGQGPPQMVPSFKAPKSTSFWTLLLVSLLSAGLAAGLVMYLTPSTRPTPQVIPQETTPNPPSTLLPTPTTAAVAAVKPTSPAEVLPETGHPAPLETLPPPSPSPTTPPATLREFTVEGSVDGVHLHLDFLVFGAGRSFASINGKEVREGGEITGFVVEQIQEDRVILRGPGGLVVLKAH